MRHFRSGVTIIFGLLIIALMTEFIARGLKYLFAFLLGAAIIYLLVDLVRCCQDKNRSTAEKTPSVVIILTLVVALIFIIVYLVSPNNVVSIPIIGEAMNEIAAYLESGATMLLAIIIVAVVAYAINPALGYGVLIVGAIIIVIDIIKSLGNAIKSLDNEMAKIADTIADTIQRNPLLIVLIIAPIVVLYIRSFIKAVKEPIVKTMPEPEPEPANKTDFINDDENVYMDDEERIDVDSMSGADFERFCADLLRIHGYTDVYVTPGSGDHGIDITAEKDTLKWGFQCKRWGTETKVDNTTVAQTYTGKAIYSCDIVAIITTSTFTRQAESDAKQLGVKLWGRRKLMELMEEMEDRDNYYFSRTA